MAGDLSKKDLLEQLQGWFGYAQWANTYNLRKEVLQRISDIEKDLIRKI